MTGWPCAARASTISRISTSTCLATSWWSSPACRAPASPRSPSTPSTPKGSGATWNRCRSYARQFLEQMEKPDVDLIDGLSPAIAIEQKTTGSNPRSTVGTVTEIYDYLRLLFANIGIPHCHLCGREISSQSLERIIDMVMLSPNEERINVMAPVVRGRKGEFKKELAGAARARLHQGPRRRPAALARRGPQARSPPQPHHRRRRRSPDPEAGDRAPADRVGRSRAQPRRRHRRHQHARRRRSAVLAAAGLHLLRRQHAGDDAARLLVQLAARRLPGMPGARRGLRLRSGAAGAGREPVAAGRRDCAVGEGRQEAREGSARPRSASSSGSIWRSRSAACRRSCATCCSTARRRKGRPRRRRRKTKGEVDPFGAGFEGLVPNLRRRYEEGSWVEQESLEPYRALRPCPSCQGRA